MEPSLKVTPSMPEKFNVSAVPSGPSESDCFSQISHVHPLQQSERGFSLNRHNLNMSMLRNREGLHAPLKISMEIHAAKKVGRLPFLESSNAQLDVLTGRDERMEFSDFLGTSEFNESFRQPHAVMERSLQIL